MLHQNSPRSLYPNIKGTQFSGIKPLAILAPVRPGTFWVHSACRGLVTSWDMLSSTEPLSKPTRNIPQTPRSPKPPVSEDLLSFCEEKLAELTVKASPGDIWNSGKTSVAEMWILPRNPVSWVWSLGRKTKCSIPVAFDRWAPRSMHNRIAGFGPCFHLPGFHFGPGVLSHSQFTLPFPCCALPDNLRFETESLLAICAWLYLIFCLFQAACVFLATGCSHFLKTKPCPYRVCEND